MRYATTPRKRPVFVPDAVFRTLEERRAADSIAAALVKAGIQAVVVPIASKGVETYQVGSSAGDCAKAQTVAGNI